MAITHYHSTDTGSPGRSLSGSTINRLRQILRACLVDGYQGKPGAGWRVIHEHERGFSLQNGPGTGIINFVQNSSAENPDEVIQIYLLETVTSTSAAILSGDNLRSGTWYSGSNVTTRHTMNGYWILAANLSWIVWSVVADERTCIFTAGIGNAAPTAINAFGSMSLYFGEIKSDLGLSGAATFVASGGQITAPNVASQDGFTLSGGYTVLRNMKSGLFIPAGTTDCYCPEMSDGDRVLTTGQNIADTLVVPAEIRVNPLRAYSGSGGIVGKFRGCVADDTLRRYGIATLFRTLGLPVDMNSIGRMVDVGGISLAPFANAKYQFMATTHPDFW
ncbi:hypothetical protein [Pseudomonas paraeruginosa]|uniref:hypothetical protein n=1 Tax=Pseudomonas paraeruginosa TaxID=2994495 RepID=UPI0039FC98C2